MNASVAEEFYLISTSAQEIAQYLPGPSIQQHLTRNLSHHRYTGY